VGDNLVSVLSRNRTLVAQRIDSRVTDSPRIRIGFLKFVELNLINFLSVTSQHKQTKLGVSLLPTFGPQRRGEWPTCSSCVTSVAAVKVSDCLYTELPCSHVNLTPSALFTTPLHVSFKHLFPYHCTLGNWSLTAIKCGL
jgi:hypothetical protein